LNKPIASILALRPSVIVLDEPTANLDPAGGYEVTRVVGDLRSRLGATLLVVEHDISNLAVLADRLIVMDGGRIVESGTPRKLLSQESYLSRQFQLARVTAGPGK